MGVIAPLQRTILSRSLVYYRAAPDVVAPLLPDGLEPSVYRGFTLIGLSWTRVRGIHGRLLPSKIAPTSDELAFCFSVEPRRASAHHGVWVTRRETNSRFSANWASRVLGGEYHLARFDVDETPFALELAVDYEGAEELYLRAELCHEFIGSVFLSSHEVEDWLQRSDRTEPRSRLVPEAPDLSVVGGKWTIDPLAVYELRCPFFEDRERFPEGSIQLDSAFRMVRRRPVRAPEAVNLRSARLRASAPYVPI